MIELQKPIDKPTKMMKYHTYENHNYHINKYGRCLYCEQGSKYVQKKLLEEWERLGKL